MHPEERGLLLDVCRNREDDGPRLIYADWLEDRGQDTDAERAELIRLQCRLASEPIDAPLIPLVPRETELLLAHGERWAHDCVPGHDIDWITRRKVVRTSPVIAAYLHAAFRRGFLVGLSASLDVFLARAQEIFSLCPLEQLDLTDCPGYGEIQPSGHASGRIGWRLLRDKREGSNLPAELWSRLRDGDIEKRGKWRWYYNKATARRALSSACVRLGRHLAFGEQAWLA